MISTFKIVVVNVALVVLGSVIADDFFKFLLGTRVFVKNRGTI